MRWFSGLVCGIAAFVTSFGQDATLVEAQDKTEVVKVSAKDLLEAYKGIEKEPDLKKKFKKGDDLYKGKRLEVTGVMSNVIGATSPYFIMEGGTGFRARVWCAFGNEFKESLSKMRSSKQLKSGVSVTVQGTCAGMMGKDLRIDDCLLISPMFAK